MVKRIFDITISSILLICLSPVFVAIYALVYIYDFEPPIHWSKRIGVKKKIFLMPKFRSMKTNTPQVATHLFDDADKFLTPIGKMLRKTSLDELPQVWSVFKGDMSFVGPRPALYNQDDLVLLRDKFGVNSVRPGITGLAQISGRDELALPVKVQYDFEYVKKNNLIIDLKIIWLTFFKVIQVSNIKH